MDYAVEELLEVHIHHPPIARRHVLLRALHSVVRAPIRAKAKACVREGRIDQRLEHLEQSLLDEAVQHCRDA